MPRKAGVGAIVAGCFVVALLLAIALVLFPFAGARENAISGAVLLAFTCGLALMVILTTRWSDRPQRWAMVPAVVLAILGAILFAWPGAVFHDSLAWLWSAALLALAYLVMTRARRDLPSRFGRWLLYSISVLLAVAALGTAYESWAESADRRNLPPSGRLVDVGGRRLHLDCTGAGSPTVVLLPGFGGFSSTWAWIAPAIADDTRVCAYDRAGRAWSEGDDSEQDGIALAADLHALLASAQVPAPYVLAGHSFGGLAAMTFAERYPRDVAGMVLLDATSPHMFTGIATYPRFYEGYRRVTALFPSLARLGVGRVAYRSAFDAMPPRVREAGVAFSSTARFARSERDEWAEAPALMRQAGALRTLGDRPLIVLTAGRDMQEGWIPLQDSLAALSTNSVHRMLPDAVHDALVSDKAIAAQSAQAILEVVHAVRTGDRLH